MVMVSTVESALWIACLCVSCLDSDTISEKDLVDSDLNESN